MVDRNLLPILQTYWFELQLPSPVWLPLKLVIVGGVFFLINSVSCGWQLICMNCTFFSCQKSWSKLLRVLQNDVSNVFGYSFQVTDWKGKFKMQLRS